jgi:hypothetical protein
MVISICQMPRASDAQKAERLNHARLLLLQHTQLPAAVAQLARECSISQRQAYRYVTAALTLKKPVPANRSENRVHRQDLANPDSATAYLCRFDGCHLERPRQSGSDRFPASWGRSWLTALRRTGRFSWSIDWTVCFRKNWCRPMKLSCQTNLNGSQPQARQLSQNPRR